MTDQMAIDPRPAIALTIVAFTVAGCVTSSAPSPEASRAHSTSVAVASFEARVGAGWTAEIHPAPAAADQAVGQDEDEPSRPPSPAPARPVTIALVTPPEPPPRPVVGPRPAVDASEPPQTTGSIAPLASPGVPVKAASLTPSDIARNMIAASRAYYRRTRSACACPDDTDELGRLCGDRSGYRGPLVLRPLCQEADITAEMIEDYKRTGSIIFAGQ